MQFPDNLLRLMQVFGLGPASSMNEGPQNQPDATPENTYNPHHDVSDLYRQALQDMPTREAPGKMRSIFGAMAGLGAGVHPAGIAGGQPIGFVGDPNHAIDVTDKAINAPYYTKLNDWSDKTKALGFGAAEEDRYNVNERTRYIGQQARDVANRRADTAAADQESKNKKRDADIENAQNRTKISQQRADAYQWKTEHPNHILKEDEHGHIVSIDPQTSESLIVTGEDGEPIKSANLPMADKLKLQIHGRLQEIGAKGNEDRKTEGVKEDNRQSDITARGDQTRETNDAKPGKNAPGTKPQTTAELKKKLLDAYNEHPEWQAYIDPKAGTIKPAKDQAIASAIHDYIYGKDIELPAQGSQASKPTPVPVTDPKDERVVITDLNGKALGTIPKTDIPKLDKTKYKVKQ